MKNEVSVLIKEGKDGEIEVINAYINEDMARNESKNLNSKELKDGIYYELPSTSEDKELLLTKPSNIYVVIRLSEDELDVMFSFETEKRANEWGSYWETIERGYKFKTFKTNLIY